MFYLNDYKRGLNWKVVQKVNHRSISDVPETKVVIDDLLTNKVFQEEESIELQLLNQLKRWLKS